MRRHLAREAARLMYEEEVSEYFVAKRMAAKRLLGHGGQKRMRYRPKDLPSNGEIQAALLELAEITEGDSRLDRLHDMRRLALSMMHALASFEPRLIGSVATGHIRRGSDIDIQLFVDDRDAPEDWLRRNDWPYEKEDVLIRRPQGFCEYKHLRLDLEYPVELTVYDRMELRHRPRSSTDGLPIQRINMRLLSQMLQEP